MRSTRAAVRTLLLAVALAAMPAGAELYKWVDENGVTNYSDEPPANPALASKVQPVGGSLSVYTPDPALGAAIQRFRERPAPATVAEPASGSRVGVIRVPGPALSPDPPEVPYDAYPYGYAPAYIGHGFKQRRLHPAHLPAGAIAGTVTGSSGYIPGNSAYAPRQFPARPARPSIVYRERR